MTGTALVALGVAFYAHTALFTGGTAGIALPVQYASGWALGAVFLALNPPFAWLALRTLDWPVALKISAAAAALSALGAVALNLAVAINHKPARHMGLWPQSRGRRYGTALQRRRWIPAWARLYPG